MMYYNGEGVAQDKAIASNHFTLSLSLDPECKTNISLESCYYLGLIFYFGVGGIDKSLERAEHDFSKTH